MVPGGGEYWVGQPGVGGEPRMVPGGGEYWA